MSTIQLNLNDDIISAVKEISSQKNISIEQFIIDAIENQVSLNEQAQYLQMRSDRAKTNSFDIKSFSAKIPSTPPDPEDM